MDRAKKFSDINTLLVKDIESDQFAHILCINKDICSVQSQIKDQLKDSLYAKRNVSADLCSRFECESKKGYDKSMVSISTRISEAKDRLDRQQQQLTRIAEETDNIDKQRSNNEEKSKEIDQQVVSQIPSLRRRIEQYQEYSGIRWNYSSFPSHCEGIMLKQPNVDQNLNEVGDTTPQVIPFCFDLKKQTNSEIRQKLSSLIGQSAEEWLLERESLGLS